MKAFFDKLTKGGKDDHDDGDKKPNQKNKNPFANFGGPKTFSGQGQSLGGSQPGKTMSVRLEDPGPLGMGIEKRPNSEASAIVSLVVPGGQAERAGLQRGDILYWHGQDEEISYDQFIQLAGSDTRPLEFDIRRIKTKAPPSSSETQTKETAEAYQRKQVMIAAAEAREKAAKQWNKPIPKKGKEPPVVQVINEYSDEPMSEEAKKAVLAAKSGETELAKQLGYNPYETNRSTAGQARSATVAITHGTIGNTNQRTPKVAPPKELPAAQIMDPVSLGFEDAYAAIVTTNPPTAVVASFGVMRKLMANATTKGQASAEEGAKFRRVRLSNDKIKAAISEVHGALDLMMSVGFLLVEEDGESYLMYPAGQPAPRWLKTGLNQMEQYEQNAKA